MADALTAGEHLDIEARQDELLRQLDELNTRVELALVALTGDRSISEGISRLIPRGGLSKAARAA